MTQMIPIKTSSDGTIELPEEVKENLDAKKGKKLVMMKDNRGNIKLCDSFIIDFLRLREEMKEFAEKNNLKTCDDVAEFVETFRANKRKKGGFLGYSNRERNLP